MNARAVSFLLWYGIGGFVGFVGVTQLAAKLPFIEKLDKEKRFFIVTCVTSLCMSLLVTPLALYALYRIYFDPVSVLECGTSGSANIVNMVVVSDAAQIACGLTCGYFLQDCMNMLLNPKQFTKELGGASAYAIMWMHHVLSILIWPYALIYSKAAFFVIYFIATEVTNIGQNAYLIASRGKLLPGEIPIGIIWIGSFFLVRVMPVPWLVYAYVKTMVLQSCGLELPELFVARTTVPIPILLNLFWFHKMVKKLMRMAKRAKEGTNKQT